MRYGNSAATQLTQGLATQCEGLADDHIGSFEEGAGGGGAAADGGSPPPPAYLRVPLELASPLRAHRGTTPASTLSQSPPSTPGAGSTPAATPSSSGRPRRRIRSAPSLPPLPPPPATGAAPADAGGATVPWTAVTPAPPSGAPAMECVAATAMPPGKVMASPAGASSPLTLPLVSPPRGQRRVRALAPTGGAGLGKRRRMSAATPSGGAPSPTPAGPALVATAPLPGRLRAGAAGGGAAPSRSPPRRLRQQRLELAPIPEVAPAASVGEQSGPARNLRKRPRRSFQWSPPPLRHPQRAPGQEEEGGGATSGFGSDSPAPSGRGDRSDASFVDETLTVAEVEKARGAAEEGVGDEDDFADEVLGSGRKVAAHARRVRLGLLSRSPSPATSGSLSATPPSSGTSRSPSLASAAPSGSSVSSAGSVSSGGTSSSSGEVRVPKRRLVLELSSDSDSSAAE